MSDLSRKYEVIVVPLASEKSTDYLKRAVRELTQRLTDAVYDIKHLETQCKSQEDLIAILSGENARLERVLSQKVDK